jgi:hypothetical protein
MDIIRPVTAHIQVKDTRMLTQQGKLGLRVGPDVPGQHRLHDAGDLADSLQDCGNTGKHETVPHQPRMQFPHRIDQSGLIRRFVFPRERRPVCREEIAHDVVVRAAISTRLNLRSAPGHQLERAGIDSFAHPAVLDQRVINVPQQQHLLASRSHAHPPVAAERPQHTWPGIRRPDQDPAANTSDQDRQALDRDIAEWPGVPP